jgi:predicted nucleotidyltransferase component of viral defense system
MIFNNAMSFKAKIKQVAADKGITAQQVQQNYLIEAFLNKLSKSNYKSNFIVKGGYLIGGLVGLDLRSTKDLDVTIKGFDLTPENLSNIVVEVLLVDTEESFAFELAGIEEIRETDDYPCYRIKLIARFERIRETVTIDVTAGDAITPGEVDFGFNPVFGGEVIELFSYPLATTLAEKIETILSRGIATTRPRDFYDVYILSKLEAEHIDFNVLHQALSNTMKRRKSVFNLEEYALILKEIRDSEFQKQLWVKYQKQYRYAKTIRFAQVIEATELLLSNMQIG